MIAARAARLAWHVTSWALGLHSPTGLLLGRPYRRLLGGYSRFPRGL